MSTLIESGEAVDVGELTRDCPQYRQQLEMLLPTLEAVVDLERHVGASEVIVDENSNSVRGRLGDFRIFREIGRGGMGIVYEAEQLLLGRSVALKVLPFAAMLDERHLQRFKNEARAAATLNHPNIVPVYFVGAERSIHFYAMQLIDGLSLAEIIAHLRDDGEDADPSADPSCATQQTHPIAALRTEYSTNPRHYFRKVAGIGCQIAAALAHAHEAGIVHRDVKPGNILIDKHGKPWITDFGLARIDAENSMTVSGDLLGTLRYMSPEQAGGCRHLVDHRVDIFSLGATLYELATLHPVCSGQDRETLLKQIALEESRRPQQINLSIPRDLETIILKAIRKAPEQRYATAAELSDDLRRFLDEEPIHAKRPTWSERIFRWSQQHRALVLSAVASMILLSIAMSIGMVLVSKAYVRESAALNRESAALGRAEREFERANASAERAEANLRMAQHVIHQMIQRAINDISLFPELRQSSHGLLNEALEYNNTLLHQNDSSPQAQLVAAQAAMRVGDIQASLGKHQDSLEAYQLAVTLLADLHDEHPGDLVYLDGLVEAHSSIGSLLYSTDQHPSAKDALLRALQLGEIRLSNSPETPSYRLEVAALKAKLAMCMRYTGDLRQARDLCLTALKDLPPIGDHVADSAQFYATRARIRSHLALLTQRSSGRREHAVQAVQDQRLAVKRDPENWNYKASLSSFLNNLAIAEHAAGHRSQEAAARQERLGLSRRVLQQFPAVVRYRADLVDALKDWARIEQQIGLQKEALEHYREALAQAQQLLDRHPDYPEHQWLVARSSRQLGEFLLELDRFQDAIDVILPTRPLWLALVDRRPDEVALINNRLDIDLLLAKAYTRLGEQEAAQQSTDQAMDAINDHDKAIQLRPNSPRHFKARALALCRLRQYEAACADFDKVLELEPDNADVCHLYARSLLKTKVMDEVAVDRAVQRAQQAVDLRPDDKEYWDTLGLAHFHAGQWQAALDALQESLDSRSSATRTYLLMAISSFRLGSKETAQDYYEMAMSSIEDSNDADMPGSVGQLRAEAEKLLGISARPDDSESLSEKQAKPL